MTTNRPCPRAAARPRASSTLLLAVSATLLFLPVISCGGGGGGGTAAGQPPSLVSVVFAGSTPTDTTPDPGDTLTFFFTRTVKLTGAILDDSKLELSNGSLGTGLAAPAQIDDRTIRVVLGTGVNFVVATDTIKLAETQDVVTDPQNASIDTTKTVTIQLSDGAKPTISWLAVCGIPDELNGRGAAGGVLQLPRTGFTLAAKFDDPGGAIDTNGFLVSSSVDVRSGGTLFAAGANLFDELDATNVTAAEFLLTVPSTVVFAEGDQSLQLIVKDTSGLLSDPVTQTFRIRTPTNEARPLESGQTWFIDLSRDLDALSSRDGTGNFVIIDAPVAGANTVPDFDEDLTILGLRTDNPLQNVVGSQNSNEVVLGLIQAAILENLQRYYAGTTVQFTFSDPGPFPSPRPFVAYDKANHSRIAVGGATTASGTLGTAIYDSNNAQQDNNTLDVGTYDGVALTARLGIFVHTMIEADMNRIGSGLRADFDSLIRFRGIPVGEEATADATRLANIVSKTAGDARQDVIQTAISNFGRFVAVLLAHECGHSVGLVQDGAMPGGLYGGMPAQFPGSTDGHIDLTSTSIFPSTATEIMSPAVSYERSVADETDFNPLIRSYLQERTYYDAK
ncbi:MAG: hypothetical protein KDC95_10095 [Planctomycetes bacterium]|nr:hypothetical protein [Planctomycetota bacterium]